MKRTILVAAAVAGTIGVVPAQGQTISLSTVLSHTRAANMALTRAVAAFNAHAYGAGSQALAKNRSQIGLAVSQTARLIQAANDPASRLAAAKAVVAVAKQEGADQRALAAAERQLPRGGLLQDRAAAAVNADTHRAANAVAKLQALMPLLPTHAQAGIANAFSHVTATHRSAVTQLARDTTTWSVGRIAKNQAAADIEADVTDQALRLMGAGRRNSSRGAQAVIDRSCTCLWMQPGGRIQEWPCAACTGHSWRRVERH